MSFWWYKAYKNCVYWLFISQLLSYPSLRIRIQMKNDPTVGEGDQKFKSRDSIPCAFGAPSPRRCR